jgi:CheY-like chemotaxis protein
MESRKPLVCIVDDNDANLKIIGNMLKQIDIDISLASSGGELIGLMEVAKPDLIILDIIMPGLNGFEVYKRLSNEGITNKDRS